jgi:hypothetical protein
MSRLEEMLREGKPPGFKGSTKDPTSPDVAIPRALKKLEQTQSAGSIAKGAGFSVNTLKRTWGI